MLLWIITTIHGRTLWDTKPSWLTDGSHPCAWFETCLASFFNVFSRYAVYTGYKPKAAPIQLVYSIKIYASILFYEQFS